MKAYIEEGAWLVCSFDLAGVPQQLQRHLSDESHRVQHISGKRLLTALDKQTKDCFKCKLPVKQYGGLGALVGGMVGGIILIASGPVGWAFFGAVVAVTVAAAAGGAIGGIIVATFMHDCAGPQKDGEWQAFHSTVKIKGEDAILYQHSMLTCGNGGILIAFESFETAQAIADKANNYAWMEIGAQVLSNAVVGVITGRGLKDGDDWDWLTIITTPVGYYHVDILNPSFTPEESLKYGAGWASINFIVGAPWFPEIVRKWGAEISDIEDIGWAATILAIGYISDKGESCLNASAENTVKNGRKSHINISGKTVIATSIK